MSTGSQGFVDRTVHPLGVVTFGAWNIKRYALAVAPSGPRPEVLQAADAATAAALAPRPRAGPGPHIADSHDATSLVLRGRPVQIGFTIIHEARPACFLQINRWRSGVDLVQRYLTAPLTDPQQWTPVTGAAIGCVWELPLIAHERDAWVRHVLTPTDGPDLQAYLDDVQPT